MVKFFSKISMLSQIKLQSELQQKPVWLHLTGGLSPLDKIIFCKCSMLNNIYTFEPKIGYINVIAVVYSIQEADYLEKRYDNVIVYTL